MQTERNKKKIMLIDDDLGYAKKVSESLEELGFFTAVFDSPVEAITAFDKTNYDMVITDYHMSEMQGIEVIKAIKSRNSMIPIIVISGNLDEEVKKGALMHGACEFFHKPLDFEQLIQSIIRL